MAVRQTSRSHGSPIKIFLVGTQPIVLEGLRATLQKDLSLSVVGQALSFDDAVPLIKKRRPHLAILEFNGDFPDAVESIARMRHAFPQLKVLLFCAHFSEPLLAKAIEFGIDGVVTKHSSREEIERAIHTISDGYPYFCPEIMATFIEMCRSVHRKPMRPSRISRRENEVLELVAQGLTSQQIADRLHVGLRTVHSHREHIKDKLGIRSVAGLTKYVLSGQQP